MRTVLGHSDDVFETRFQILEGGSGYAYGIVDQPNESAPADIIFTMPRRMLRVGLGSPVQIGMVIQTDTGIFMLANHGAAVGVYRSFLLFEATSRVHWQRRSQVVDPISNLPGEGPLQDLGMIYLSYEPDNRESLDRVIKVSIETGKFISASPVQRDDMLGTRKVVRADVLMGLTIGNLN